MKVIVTSPNGALTQVNLGLLPVWRLHFGADREGLALKISYPSGTTLSGVTLANVPIQAQPDFLEKVASRVASTGTLEGDLDRTTEALKELINLDRVRTSDIERITTEARELVQIYWRLRTDLVQDVPGQVTFGKWSLDLAP